MVAFLCSRTSAYISYRPFFHSVGPMVWYDTDALAAIPYSRGFLSLTPAGWGRESWEGEFWPVVNRPVLSSYERKGFHIRATWPPIFVFCLGDLRWTSWRLCQEYISTLLSAVGTVLFPCLNSVNAMQIALSPLLQTWTFSIPSISVHSGGIHLRSVTVLDILEPSIRKPDHYW